MIVKSPKIKNKRKEKIYNKKEKTTPKLIKSNKISDVRIQNLNIFGEPNFSLANPVKKKKRTEKNCNNISKFNKKIFSKKAISNKNNTSKNRINFYSNKKDYPYNLSNNQLYEMFLKINNYSDYELNELSYYPAIKMDKRTYFQYYLSLLRTKHLLIFSFLPTFDYNSQILKIFLFFFNFSLSFLVNALFFNDETMHKIYEEKGSFNFIYNIPQIIFSSLISGFIDNLIKELALTDSNLICLKQKIDRNKMLIKKQKTLKIIKIKIALFFIISFSLLSAFWFYLACFCAVYKNTQLHLIKDTVISFGTSMITPLGIYILPGIFRLSALNAKKKDKKFIFQFSKVLQWF